MKKKIFSLLFSVLLLMGCNKNNETSNKISSSSFYSSSSEINSNSSISTSSSISISLPSKTKEDYLTNALTNLLLLNNYCEISLELNKKVYNSYFYYDIIDSIYQLQYKDNYLTYKDSKIYFDNENNHYYLNFKEFNSSSLISSLIALEYIDIELLELKKENTYIILSYDNGYSSIDIYLKEFLTTSLEKIIISNLTSTLTITPKRVVNKYYDINEISHVSLNEKLSFLNKYLELLNLTNLDISLSMNYNDFNFIGSFKSSKGNYQGNISYLYRDINIDVVYDNESIILNNEIVNLEYAIEYVFANIDKSILNELLVYLFNILDSQLIIENETLRFINNDFIEELVFNYDEELIIISKYLNLSLEIREI